MAAGGDYWMMPLRAASQRPRAGNQPQLPKRGMGSTWLRRLAAQWFSEFRDNVGSRGGCSDVTLTRVRFRWQGDQIQVLDTIPALFGGP
jgi:hypothetical protein